MEVYNDGSVLREDVYKRQIIAIERERGIDREILFEAIEEALKKAYRNHYSTEGNVRAEIDKETGVFNVYSVREVVPDDFEEYDPLLHIYQKDARALGHPGELGDEVETLATPDRKSTRLNSSH